MQLIKLLPNLITSHAWVAFGFLAQFVFFLRFVVQWIDSEKQKKSVIPISFWYLSILGSIMIFIYALQLKDIVFTTAQVLSLVIYVRNIILYKQTTHTA